MGKRLTGQEALFNGFSLEQHVLEQHILLDRRLLLRHPFGMLSVRRGSSAPGL